MAESSNDRAPSQHAEPRAYFRPLVILGLAAALLATGLMVELAVQPLRLKFASLGSFVAMALGYAVLAWLWSAAILLGLYFSVPSSHRAGLAASALAASKTAVWFAPATILLSFGSPGAAIAAAALVVNATRVLYFEWRRHAPVPPPAPAQSLERYPSILHPPEPAGGLFSDALLPAGRFWRELPVAWAVSLALQGGVWAFAMRHPMVGGGLLAMSVALLTVVTLSRGVWWPGPPPTLPRAAAGVCATILLAAALTVGGMAVHFRRAGRPGSGDPFAGPGLTPGARAAMRALLDAREARDADRQEDPNTGVSIADGDFPGVILWPEIKPVVTLVAPLLARGGMAAAPANPVGIPFGGEYWMWRRPNTRPPAKSWFQRASPTAISFSTTDHGPLQMEARQALDQPIETSCCSAIRVEIRNVDRHPGAVSLELYLIDRQSPNSPFEFLGSAPVRTAPDPFTETLRAVPETLTFYMPPAPRVKQFDLIRVVFRRALIRADKSARMAIDRFVLVP